MQSKDKESLLTELRFGLTHENMRIVDYDDNKYDDWLKIIVDSRLLFCTRKELGEHVGYASLASKSFKDLLGDNLFRKKAIFHELCDEVRILTDDLFDLEEEIECYKRASVFFKDKMQLKYFICEYDEERKKHTKALMEYVYGSHRLPEDIRPKVEKVFKMLYDEENDRIESYYGIAYIILMVLNVLPPINDGRDIEIEKLHADYMDILSFMEDFLQEQGMGDMVITDINMFKEKVKQMYALNEHLNRLFIVFTVDSILIKYHIFMHNEIHNEVTKENMKDMRWPKIDGIWCTTPQGNTGDFWKIEEVSNAYFVYHFFVKAGHQLEYSKCEMYLYGYSGNLLDDKMIFENKKDEKFRKELYYGRIISPNYFKSLLAGKSLDNTICQFICRIEHPSLSTMEYFSNNIVDWFPHKFKLYKLSEESKLYDIEAKWQKTEIESSGIFRDTIYAVTTTHLYVGIINDMENYSSEECDSTTYEEYYKVPKSLNDAFYDVNVNDAVGILEIEIDHAMKRYVAFPNFLNYYDVSTPEAMAENSIELVKSIT